MFEAYKRTFDFYGRSNRKEYWLFILMFAIQMAVGAGVDIAFFNGLETYQQYELTGPAWGIVILGNMITSISVQVRRLHDINRTGWWVAASIVPFAGIALLVFDLMPGTPDCNRFGQPPGQSPAGVAETFA